MKFFKYLAVTAAATLAFAGTASADSYPDRPIRMIVPFSAGGPTDNMARIVAEYMGKQLDQTIIVLNKPGADNLIAARELIKSPADGYTVMFTTNGLLSVAPAIHKDFPVKPLEQFSYIGGVTTYPYVFVSSMEDKREQFSGFLEDTRKDPGSVSYAVVGNVSAVAGGLLTDSLNVQMLPVRYKGNSETVPDIISKRVALGMFAPSFTLTLINDKKLRPLFVTGENRLKSLPDLPLASEVDPALKEFSASAVVWTAVVAPKGLPDDIRAKLESALKSVVDDESFVAKVEDLGDQVAWKTSADTRKRVEQDGQTWTRVVQSTELAL
ncbi:tripartite tricarboxylate transporter substrate binding protein [Pusillimonas sp. MFBS29]|uniref:Bug family tripartite tricarboxylate transporter substrate binding protein n=1 Tax=Pusillimonas sp. MFBS29 TaxID=2886690 RepID=UPI001D111158|nr:tripartite tricarboxylate transporter substrate binding protein [Pusillimonas sp. MFBS29]MCC2594859.1 tripartite tricarboxylate transporter substrate binding protein [Pusillimonas sp. MFBS29]